MNQIPHASANIQSLLNPIPSVSPLLGSVAPIVSIIPAHIKPPTTFGEALSYKLQLKTWGEIKEPQESVKLIFCKHNHLFILEGKGYLGLLLKQKAVSIPYIRMDNEGCCGRISSLPYFIHQLCDGDIDALRLSGMAMEEMSKQWRAETRVIDFIALGDHV